MLEHTRGYKYYGERGRKGAKPLFTFLLFYLFTFKSPFLPVLTAPLLQTCYIPAFQVKIN